MPRVVALDRQVVAIGDYHRIAAAIPNNVSELNVRIDRYSWPERVESDKTVFRLQAGISLDDGATWRDLGGIGDQGGNQLDERGNPIIETHLKLFLPEGRKRQLGVRYQVYKDLDIQINLDLS